MNDAFAEVKEIIRGAERFVLVTHVNPDGDGIGSQIALHRHLVSLGKTSRIINGHPPPANYRFLHDDGEVEVYDADRHGGVIAAADAIFVLDISNWDRLGACGPAVRESRARKICIDHHVSNNRFADVNVIDRTASSTGEMIYRLIEGSGDGLTPDIALPLYVSIITDTGSFRFSNTNSRVHRIAAHLVDLGVNPRHTYEKIYETSSIGRLRLLGLALSELRMAASDRLVWVKITREMLDRTGTRPQDCEGFVDYLRLLKDVEVCLLLIEVGEGRLKVSLRSRGAVDVNRLAAEFGGGGHRHAAGALLQGSVEALERSLLQSVERLLAR
jgi:phosphoesterase RecJ-like protein